MSCRVQEEGAYLSSQFVLDLIHEDESVWMTWLWPAQGHPVLVTLPGHRSRYVVCLFYKRHRRT